MYIPRLLEQTDLAQMQELIRSYPLGMWVTQAGQSGNAGGELVANHVPFLLDAQRGPYGTLVGHVAKANPIWESFSTAVPSLVVFRGAEAYITPSWYPSKQSHGRAVPTWNYAVVHASGMPRAICDKDWLLQLVSRLTDSQEASRAEPWKVADAPADYIDRLLTSIVGIEIPIERIVGKWKANQTSPEADKRGVVQGLLERGDTRAKEMAALVGGQLTPPLEE
jgi:transcriptional regulator